MTTYNYDDTFEGSVNRLKDVATSMSLQTGCSMVEVVKSISELTKALDSLGNGAIDSYANCSYAEGTQSKACGQDSWATGWQNVYGITVNDNDRNTIFSIHNDTPEKPIKLIKEDDNPFYIDPEVIQQGGWLDGDID